jgi:hypothetical protein
MTQREQENIDVLEFRNQLDLLLIQAKEMEKEQSYTYDELRTIAYNAYCLAQLDEPTEGKYNLWIQQFKK